MTIFAIIDNEPQPQEEKKYTYREVIDIIEALSSPEIIKACQMLRGSTTYSLETMKPLLDPKIKKIVLNSVNLLSNYELLNLFYRDIWGDINEDSDDDEDFEEELNEEDLDEVIVFDDEELGEEIIDELFEELLDQLFD